MKKSERHFALCKILNEIYKQKNQNYGDSFHDTFVEEGLVMARIRLTDKLNRFKTLSRNPNMDSADESITDTLMDLANYALMTIMEIREDNGTDKSDDPAIHATQNPANVWTPYRTYAYDDPGEPQTTLSNNSERRD